MSVSIVGLTDADLRVFANIPLGETMYTMGQVEARLGSITGTVAEYIASAVSTAWKAGGSTMFGSLNSGDDLSAENEGKVYHTVADESFPDRFVVTSGNASYFVDPIGTVILPGTDVAVINVAGSGESPTYKYNVLAATDSSVVKEVSVSGYGILPTDGTIHIDGSGAVTVAAGSGTDRIVVSASNATSSAAGLMTSAQYTKLSNIASGAEVNQNAFSKVAVSGQTTVEADAKTDTLSLVAGDNVAITTDASTDSVTIGAPGVVKYVTIPYSGAGSASGSLLVGPDSCGKLELSHVVTMVETSSGIAEANSCGIIKFSGLNGISVVLSSGTTGLVDIDGSALQSGLSAVRNFSKITVRNSAGSTVTNGEITPASNADSGLGFKAGNYVTLYTSGKNVVVAANPPVTDVKTGTTSFMSGTVAKIPTATSGALGLVRLRDGLGGTEDLGWQQTAPTVHAVSGALQDYVYGGDLHSNLLISGLPYPESGTYASGTLYALLAALHNSESCGEED